MPTPIKNVGGQAVIEGVMMRAGSGLAVAVRRASGEIVVKDKIFRSISDRFRLLKLPFFRGIVVLIETLISGLDALSFSAEQAEIENKNTESNVALTQKSHSEFWMKVGIVLTLMLAFVFGIGLFIALPHGLTYLVGKFFGGLALQSVWFHVIVGFFKLTIFISYLSVLSLIPDIRRVFMYHGAEHKTIANFEAKTPLTIENAKLFSTFHARCGTSFLLVVVVIAIIVFAVVFPLIPNLTDAFGSHLLAIALKIPLLFPIAGFAYEFNRWAANHLSSIFVRMLIAPGLLMQSLTTREPTADMLEVAIASLKTALYRHHHMEESTTPSSIKVYKDLTDVNDQLEIPCTTN